MSEHDQTPDWIAGLMDPAAYDHPTHRIHRIETHISWLILTGDFAYKIKKPVDLGFADFSTLKRRCHFCNEEVRLNRRYAPELYLGVVPITATDAGPKMDGPGEAFEYAVRMRQFDEDQLLDRLLAAGRLPAGRVDELAAAIAAFHGKAEALDPGAVKDAAEAAWRPVGDSLEALHENLDAYRPGVLAEIESWLLDRRDRLSGIFDRRLREGLWRECHGDLHLGNIVIWRARVTPFDGIEFNPDLRWIDVISDLAFTVMDLARKGRADLAFRLLNRYLEATGDYAGLAVLDFYWVYRLLVRAKVRVIRDLQHGHAREVAESIRPHLEAAAALARGRERFLVLTHGVSGSGKSYVSEHLCNRLGWIRIRSDRERQRLAQDPATRYTEGGRGEVYALLADEASTILAAGFPVLIDATFLDPRQRRRFRELARERGVRLLILDFHADREVLLDRVRARAEYGADPSEADESVLEQQLAELSPPAGDEAEDVFRIDTGREVDCDQLAAVLKRTVTGRESAV